MSAIYSGLPVISFSRALSSPSCGGRTFSELHGVDHATTIRAIAVIWTAPPTKKSVIRRNPALGSFFSYNFLSFFTLSGLGEQHDPGGRLSVSILAEGRLKRQFAVSDLG